MEALSSVLRAHAAGERRDFKRVRQQIAEEGQVAITIAGTCHGEAAQAGCKGTRASDGQHGRPAKGGGGGARCARRGRHGPSAAPRDTDKNTVFLKCWQGAPKQRLESC